METYRNHPSEASLTGSVLVKPGSLEMALHALNILKILLFLQLQRKPFRTVGSSEQYNQSLSANRK